MDKTAPLDRPAANPLDALLASYSVGSLEPALHALVASHLALSPANRSFVAFLEERLAAAKIAETEPVLLDRRDARLLEIFASSPAAPLAAEADIVLPAPLRVYLGEGFSDLKWRRLLPGVREHKIERAGRGDASLLWVKAGRRMPSHTHEGSETTLVLKGAFSDASGRYVRGDVEIAESDVNHRPQVEEGEDCICFAVTDAPLRLTGPIGRIVDRFFGG